MTWSFVRPKCPPFSFSPLSPLLVLGINPRQALHPWAISLALLLLKNTSLCARQTLTNFLRLTSDSWHSPSWTWIWGSFQPPENLQLQGYVTTQAVTLLDHETRSIKQTERESNLEVSGSVLWAAFLLISGPQKASGQLPVPQRSTESLSKPCLKIRLSLKNCLHWLQIPHPVDKDEGGQTSLFPFVF